MFRPAIMNRPRIYRDSRQVITANQRSSLDRSSRRHVRFRCRIKRHQRYLSCSFANRFERSLMI